MASRTVEEAADQVGSALDELARSGHPATYEAIGLRLDPTQPPWSSRLRAALAATVQEDVAARRPVRASLVVGKATRIPGPGFFTQVAAAGRDVPDLAAARRAFAEAEQQRVFAASRR